MENGVPWTQHLGQYKMPGIKMTPEMENYIVEHGAADGPYGAKGVGEISSIPISPAIANAVYNAVGVQLHGAAAGSGRAAAGDEARRAGGDGAMGRCVASAEILLPHVFARPTDPVLRFSSQTKRRCDELSQLQHVEPRR
ncbi:MAG: hypothetical protein R2873_16225 [Caldilineaceae bacterium]